MAYVRMIDEGEATAQVAEDYRSISDSYTHTVFEGNRFPVPEIYRVSSIIPPYLRFMALQNRLLTDNGQHYCESDGTVPRLMVLFATATFSSCFH